ncbi:MAG: hypothetical protein ACRDK8_14515, partial [Solirubrobacteraceae bacterium]
AWRRSRRGRGRPARAVIVSPPHSTVIAHDGGVHSVQSAVLTLDAEDLDRLWAAPNLENLGRTYWRFLTRVTLGLIRVVYGEDSRSVVLLARPLTLLRFDVPRYELEHDRGTVTWRIRDGLLVARGGRGSGWLSLDVRRLPAAEDERRGQVKIEVGVANFYPAIAAGFSTPVYEMTQSLLHVLVTHSFLRSLANLRLDVSRIGTLAGR